MDLLLHLRYFRAVAEEQHFGRAAERLRVAQPSLSQRIQRLERELGVRLLDRGRAGATLTPAGRLVLAETDALLDAADRLRTLVTRVQGGAAGTLRAAVPPQLGGATIAALLTAYRERSPGGHLDLRELTTADLTAELAAGTLDAGIVRHPCPATGLGFGPQLHQPLGALLADHDPLAQHTEVDVPDLDGRELVLFPRPTAPALHDETLTACARHGCTPSAVREVAGLEFTRALLLSGTDVVALLPRPTPEPGTTWRLLRGNPLTWRTSTAWPAGRDGPAVRLFTEAAHDVLREHAGLLPTATPRRLFPRPASEFPL